MDLIGEALGRSPDIADLLAMRKWFELDKRPGPNIGQCQHVKLSEVKIRG